MTRARAGAALEPWPASGLERVRSCPVCDDPRRVVLYDGLHDQVFYCAPGEWTLYQCGGCRCAYLDPRPTIDTLSMAYSTYITHEALTRPELLRMNRVMWFRRALANGYRNWQRGTHEQPATRLGVLVMLLLPRQRVKLDAEMRSLPRPSPGARLLDIGCGAGAFLDSARAAGWTTVGLDFDPAAVANARTRGLDVRIGTVDVLAPERGTFDAITLSHVLEHVHDPRALLRSIHDLLKPGGLFWLETPNIDASGHRVFGRSWLGLDPPRHLVLFCPAPLKACIESAGFSIVKTISRYEVTESIFVASHRTRLRENPFGDAPIPLSIKLKARLAVMRERIIPGTAEFLTLLAARRE